MKDRTNFWLAVVVMGVFALTRWPGLLPFNFSATYALMFCAGVYFPRRVAWWLPMVTVGITDVALNCYYQFVKGYDSFQVYQLVNYAIYAILIALGQRFRPQTPAWRLVGGGLLGAVLFYLMSNTAAWFFNPFNNPEYVKTFAGWLIALTKGTSGYPETWEFFRNTFLSGGLFTAMFVGAMKAAERAESEREKEAPEAEGESEEAPEPRSEPAAN